MKADKSVSYRIASPTCPKHVLLLGASGHLGQTLQHYAPAAIRLHCPTSTELDLRDHDAVRHHITKWVAQQQIKGPKRQGVPPAGTTTGKRPHGVIINAAAYTQVDAAEHDRAQAKALNATAVRNLAQSCAEHGLPLLHFSTDYVFDGQKGAPYTPADKPCPLNYYGYSKYLGEQWLQQHHQYHWLWRVSWLHGPLGRNFAQSLIQRWQSPASPQQWPMVKDQIGSPTDTALLAQTVWRVVMNYFRAQRQAGQPSFLPWGLYHFSTHSPMSRYAYAQMIFQHAQAQGLITTLPELLPVRTADFPAAAIRPRYSALRCCAELSEIVEGC